MHARFLADTQDYQKDGRIVQRVRIGVVGVVGVVGAVGTVGVVGAVGIVGVVGVVDAVGCSRIMRNWSSSSRVTDALM